MLALGACAVAKWVRNEDSGRSPCLTEYVSFKMGFEGFECGKENVCFRVPDFPR